MNFLRLSIFIFCLAAFNTHAQSNSYFKIKDDGHLYKIINVSTSGYLTVGSNSSQGVKNVQLAKWDASFNEEWSYEFSSTEISATNLIIYIKESRLGSFYLCAPTPSGNAVVFKFSADGNLTWQKEYGVSGFVIANYFQIGPEGDDGFIFGTGSCSVSNGIVKCDANGDIEWQKVYNRSDASGVVTCNGIVNKGTGYIITSKFNGDSFVNMEIDGAGTILSYKAYENPTKSMSVRNSIKYLDGIAILGDYNSGNGNIDKFICYIDTNLNVSLYNDLETTNGATLYLGDFTVDGSGQNVLLNGDTYNGASSVQYIMSLSPTGSFNWKHKTVNPGSFLDVTAWSDRIINVGIGAGGAGVPVISIMDDTGAGFCDSTSLPVVNLHPTLNLLAGTSGSYNITSFSATTTTYTPTPNVEFTRTMICGSAPVGIETIDEIQDINLYPNPATETIQVKFHSETPVRLMISDLAGKEVLNINNYLAGMNINIGNLNSGVYLIQLKSDNQVYSQKFIKE